MRPLHPSPTDAHDRLLHLDVLRGFALFGILLVNFEFFTRPLQAAILGTEPDLQGLDYLADWLVMALAESKFYPLFAMLFGAGFALMLYRSRAAAQPFLGLYLRRIGGLFAIGLAHLLLVWSGDILLIYAVTGGLMALLFRATPVDRLLGWAIVLLSTLLVLNAVAAVTFEIGQLDSGDSVIAEPEEEFVGFESEIEAVADVYRDGSYRDGVRQRIDDFFYLAQLDVVTLPMMLGYFLLGRWLLESGRLLRPSAHAGFFGALRRGGLAAGLGMSLIGTWLIHDPDSDLPIAIQALGGTLFTVGGTILALGYMALVVRHARRLSWLAPAGRMALTNYLAQSVFWTWVFYGYGLGLWGQVPRAWQVVLAVGFFALQVAFSHWWLRRFRFGPAEWLWRSLTYLRLQPLRGGSGA